MIKYKNECVGCPMGCVGSSCVNHRVMHTYCDNCGTEASLYSFNDDTEHLCEKCMEKELNDIWNKLSFKDKLEIFDAKEITIC